MKRFLPALAILFLLGIAFIACKNDEETYDEKLTAEWNATSIKIDGVVAPGSMTMTLHLKSDKSFEITTNISPFTHPTSGAWSSYEAGETLNLASNEWTIHHLEGNTLRIANTVDGKELEIDFAK